MPATIRSLARLAIALLVSQSLVSAGEVKVSWGPSDTATGYKVYRGTASGAYSSNVDAGNSLTAPATGLTDCTTWHFAITAYNSAGESGFSPEVSTWPRPVLDSASPAVLLPGQQATLTIAGTNFKGDDTFQFTNPGVQITAATVASCNQLLLTVTVAANAASGPTNLVVTHASGVAGTGVALLTIAPQTPPTVLATAPLDGATDVSLDVQPSIQFSEAVGGVISSNVRLLNAQGAAVAQGPGSPAVTQGGTLVTIVPAAPLLEGATYRIQVLGGASGVKDADGNPLAQTFLQPNGFSTVEGPQHYIHFETESGLLVAPVGSASGNAAFGGAWIDTPPGSSAGSATNPLGRATFGVLVPEAGTWFLWVRMYGDDSGSNSWFESVDGGTRKTISVSTFDSWSWVEGQAYVLSAGLHAFELGGREPETRADRVLLTNDAGFVPSEAPGADLLPPAAVSGFAAASGAGVIQLTWSNPPDPDYAHTVIRYRTDGQYPSSPADGFPLADEAGSPGGAGSHSHTGTSAGVEYRYSAFAVDDAGNESVPAHALGAVIGVPASPVELTVL